MKVPFVPFRAPKRMNRVSFRLLAAGIIWLGPETRGRQFTAADAA